MILFSFQVKFSLAMMSASWGRLVWWWVRCHLVNTWHRRTRGTSAPGEDRSTTEQGMSQVIRWAPGWPLCRSWPGIPDLASPRSLIGWCSAMLACDWSLTRPIPGHWTPNKCQPSLSRAVPGSGWWLQYGPGPGWPPPCPNILEMRGRRGETSLTGQWPL